MSISVHPNTAPVSPMKTGAWARPQASSAAQRHQEDQLTISQAGREACAQTQAESSLEQMLPGATQEDFMAQLQTWRDEHQLEVNWNAAVDPDGSIYAKAYMESLVSQYDGIRQTVEEYYAEGHQENLGFADPYSHLVEKYRYSGSPYFCADMTQAQRDMAFEQEKALLLGGRVRLNDPWALAAIGGVPKGETVEEIARQAARDVINGLIAQRKEALGLGE